MPLYYKNGHAVNTSSCEIELNNMVVYAVNSEFNSNIYHASKLKGAYNR